MDCQCIAQREARQPIYGCRSVRGDGTNRTGSLPRRAANEMMHSTCLALNVERGAMVRDAMNLFCRMQDPRSGCKSPNLRFAWMFAYIECTGLRCIGADSHHVVQRSAIHYEILKSTPRITIQVSS